MKKIISKVTLMITICLSLLVISSCFGGGGNQGTSPVQTPENQTQNPSDLNQNTTNEEKILVDASKMNWGFVSGETITDMSQLNIENTTQPVKFDVYKEYYFIIQYTISPREDNNGQLEIDMKVKFSNVSNVVGDLFQTDSPKKNFTADKNSDGTDSLTYSVTFKVPKEAGKTQTIKAVFRIRTQNVVSSDNYINGYLSSEKVKIVTSDSEGLTLLMIIESIKIEAPVISYDNALQELTIKHVEHADRYVLYVGGVEYKVDDVVVTIPGEKSDGSKYEVGENIYFALDASVISSGDHRIKIKAVTTDDQKNVKNSDYSEEILVKIN